MDPRTAAPVILALALTVALLPVQGMDADRDMAEGDGCEDCHNGFVPFTVQAIAPKDIKEGDSAEFKVRVSNPGQHHVRDIVARLSGPGFNRSGPETIDGEGVVSMGSSIDISFEVEDGATGLAVVLQEYHYTVGLSDAMLTLTAPDGHEVTSNSGTDQESVEMSESLLKRAGPGTYTITVTHVRGLRAMNFAFVAIIDYPELTRMAGIADLPPGARADVTWELEVTEEMAQDLRVIVTANASHDHDGNERSSEYTIEQAFKVGKLKKEKGIESTEIPRSIRWPLRYSMAVLLALSIPLGSPAFRRRFLDRFDPYDVKRLHCLVSRTMVPLFIIHAYLETTRFPIGSPQAVSGMAVAAMVLLLAVTGTFKGFISRCKGGKAWSWVHRLLTLGAIITLAVHWAL